jgi:SPP1 family predicted phage head-tail adaptor
LIRKGDHITQVGRLRHQVILQTQGGTADGMGGVVPSWSNTATIWADIMPASATERTQADKVIGDITHVIIVRHRAITSPNMRILFGYRTFNIVSVVNPDESGSYLKIMAREQI